MPNNYSVLLHYASVKYDKPCSIEVIFQGIFNFDSKMEVTSRSREVTSMTGIQTAGSSHMAGHLSSMEIKSEPMSIESCSAAKSFEVILISDLMNFIFSR